MKDINDIITALRVCINPNEKCEECPYNELGEWCSERMKEDAADLLEAYVSEEDDLK